MRSGFQADRPRRLWAMVALGLALAAPWLMSDYRLFQLTQVCVLAIAMLGLNLLTGWCGQISLGHGAFFALGAYFSAWLMQQLGLPDWLTLPGCAALCFAAGWLFGLPAARLEGLYLALASFALAVAVPQLCKHPLLAPWTGGSNGLVLDAVQAPALWPLSAERWAYALALGTLLAGMVLTDRLVRGQLGLAMRALRDHPTAAATIGVHGAQLKAQLFGISAMFAGIAGALSAITVRYVGPDSFDMFLSISLLVGIVVGGLASITGSLVGALFVQFVPHSAEQVSREAAWAIYGVCLLIALWVAPGGVAGLLRRVTGGRPKG